MPQPPTTPSLALEDSQAPSSFLSWWGGSSVQSPLVPHACNSAEPGVPTVPNSPAPTFRAQCASQQCVHTAARLPQAPAQCCPLPSDCSHPRQGLPRPPLPAGGGSPQADCSSYPQAGVKDTENRVALHALTRPPALLLLAAASSGLRFVLASFALALLLPVFLAVAAMKLGLRARWGSLPPPGGLGGPWVAVRGSGDVCGVLALAPGSSAGDGARVTRLSVSRWHRRRGVGRRLLAFAESRARAWAGGMGEPRARLVVPVAVAAWGVAGMLEGCGYQAEGSWGCMGYTLVREFSKEL